MFDSHMISIQILCTYKYSALNHKSREKQPASQNQAEDLLFHLQPEIKQRNR